MKGTERELLDRMCDDASPWRAEAWAAYAQICDELKRIEGRTHSARRKLEADTEIKIIRENLDTALGEMAPPERLGGNESCWSWARVRCAPARVWSALKLYYWGSCIERTWSALHRASSALYMLYDKNELLSQTMRLRELVAELPDLNSQLTLLTGIQTKLEKEDVDAAELDHARVALQELYQEAMGASDSLQIEARVLRNTLIVASGALALIVFTLGVVHLFDDSILSLCMVEKGQATGVCPAGSSSHPFDVFAIELAGMLGGILSVVIPIATGERIKTPYRVFNHQMLLKVLTGAATGLAGVVLIESELISAFTVASGAAIIGYAIFFGVSQQALTGMIDRRASSLAQETPTAKSV